jgi:hypothetical protein
MTHGQQNIKYAYNYLKKELYLLFINYILLSNPSTVFTIFLAFCYSFRTHLSKEMMRLHGKHNSVCKSFLLLQ